MKLKCLRYSKLGNAGDIIELAGSAQCQQLIAKGICEELKPSEYVAEKIVTTPAEKKKTKGGKKPTDKDYETK